MNDRELWQEKKELKIKTSELIGRALDWTVARCEGILLTPSGYIEYVIDHLNSEFTKYAPSTNWSQGGPIIKREHITLKSPTNQLTMNWEASSGRHQNLQWAHDPLIAAMRCYVASKLGDEVDVPEELCK